MAISPFEAAINKEVHRVQTENDLPITVDLSEPVLTPDEVKQKRAENIANKLAQNIKTTSGLKPLGELIK